MTPQSAFPDEPAEMAEENREPTSQRTKLIAKNLKRVRESRAISQRQFAKQLSVSSTLMNYYERGERRIPSDLLADMAELLECSVDTLMGLTKAPRKYEPEMPPEVKALWKKFQLVIKLPEHDQRAVIRLINSVSKTRAS
jgi:transcriptional regulator with XRE-family HTH domain